jgi:predicted ArsR family transcriptional regulator
MTTARQRVLNYFSKTETASAREIGRALRLAPAAVRHHLRVLVSDGRLELLSVRERQGRGRPEHLYSLPRAALGHNLAVLADALLEEAGSAIRADSLSGRLALHLTGGSGFSGQPLGRRLNLTIEKLNGMNYHSHWEAGSEGPRIILGHCPYAAIIAKHPELCQMDRGILREWTGQPVTQISKIGKEGSSVCVFILKTS